MLYILRRANVKLTRYLLETRAAEAFFAGGKNLSSTTKGRRIGEQLNHPWARGEPSQASASKEERNFFF